MESVEKGQFKGLDFDRQKIIGNYIVDFYCAEKQVVLEIDGGSHDNKAEYDAQRDAFLMGLGLCVIHILDADVKRNLAGVMDFLSRHFIFAEQAQISDAQNKAELQVMEHTIKNRK